VIVIDHSRDAPNNQQGEGGDEGYTTVSERQKAGSSTESKVLVQCLICLQNVGMKIKTDNG